MRRCLFVLPIVLLTAVTPVAAATTVVEKNGDVSISHDALAGTWSIAAGGTTLTLALDPSNDFQMLRLVTAQNKSWASGSAPDTSVTINGAAQPLGNRPAGFVYQNTTTSTNGQGVRLNAAFDLPAAGLRVTRHYAVTSGSPTFET